MVVQDCKRVYKKGLDFTCTTGRWSRMAYIAQIAILKYNDCIVVQLI